MYIAKFRLHTASVLQAKKVSKRHLSHKVVTCDVDRDLSTAYC